MREGKRQREKKKQRERAWKIFCVKKHNFL